MESLKELYRIGKGPSSSHTMGPQKAAKIFKEHYPDAKKIEVILYGSLAATGRGHMTDVAIKEVFGDNDRLNIVWKPSIFLPFHPNGMKFTAYDDNQNPCGEWTVYSIGGVRILFFH